MVNKILAGRVACSLVMISSAANAKCAFLVPCRSAKITVLSCALDINAAHFRKEWIQELAGSEVPDLMVQYRNQQIASYVAQPYDYQVTAIVRQTKVEHCDRNRPRELPDVDMYWWIDAMRSELRDSIGGERVFSYSGKSADECSKLLKASEVRIAMNESWCEHHDTSILYANIESLVKNETSE
jgi:hypothetical protein